MSPRPAGVFWARMAPGAGDRLCVDRAHGVYERKIFRVPERADGTGGQAMSVYACEARRPRRGRREARRAARRPHSREGGVGRLGRLPGEPADRGRAAGLRGGP